VLTCKLERVRKRECRSDARCEQVHEPRVRVGGRGRAGHKQDGAEKDRRQNGEPLAGRHGSHNELFVPAAAASQSRL